MISGGGGWSFYCLQTFFLPPVENKLFFLATNIQQFFLMLCRRIFLSYAFPIMFVTIWCFFLFNIFFINFDNKLFFLLTVSTIFFRLLWRQTIFFNFNLATPPPPQISNGASLIGITLEVNKLLSTVCLYLYFVCFVSCN